MRVCPCVSVPCMSLSVTMCLYVFHVSPSPPSRQLVDTDPMNDLSDEMARGDEDEDSPRRGGATSDARAAANRKGRTETAMKSQRAQVKYDSDNSDNEAPPVKRGGPSAGAGRAGAGAGTGMPKTSSGGRGGGRGASRAEDVDLSLDDSD